MLNFLLLVKKNMKKHELTIICHSPSGFSPAVARCDPATANVTGSKWTGPGKDAGESARAKRCGDDETPGATELGTEDDASGGIEHLGDLILMCIDDVYIYIYIRSHTHTYIYMCMYICTYTCKYGCIAVYIYIHNIYSIISKYIFRSFLRSRTKNLLDGVWRT